MAVDHTSSMSHSVMRPVMAGSCVTSCFPRSSRRDQRLLLRRQFCVVQACCVPLCALHWPARLEGCKRLLLLQLAEASPLSLSDGLSLRLGLDMVFLAGPRSTGVCILMPTLFAWANRGAVAANGIS